MLKHSPNGDAYLPDGAADLSEPPAPRSLGLSLAIFILAYVLLQWGWIRAHGTWIEHLVVHDLTVAPAVAAIRSLTPEIAATARGASIRATGGGLNILSGCEGTEVVFLLLAALLAVRLPWRIALPSALGGILWIFLLNQARVLALFYAFRADRASFDILHTTILPAVLVALAAAYFYGTLHFARQRLA